MRTGDMRVERPVEPARRDALGRGVPGPRRAHAVDDVVALAPALDERPEQLGRILQVDVHRDQDVAARVVDAGGERRLLAEVAREVDDPQPAVTRAAVEQMGQRVVVRAVVHEHDLEAQAGALQKRLDRRQEDIDRLLLVEHRHDQRQQRIGRPARALVAKLALQGAAVGMGREEDRFGTNEGSVKRL